MVELKVDISSEETRWALRLVFLAYKEIPLNDFIRLVNMMACLKCMLVDGFTVYLYLYV